MRRTSLTFLLVCRCVSVTATQSPVPTTLLVVDDLHLEFRMTPRTRELVGNAFRQLLKSNVQVAIVSTSDHVPITGPTTDATVLERAVSRTVGEALKPSEILAVSERQGNAELDHRAQMAIAATDRALSSTAGSAAAGRFDVIYFSAGYGAGAASPPEDLIALSLRLNTPVNTVDMFEVLAASGRNATLDSTVHDNGAHQSLVDLTARTHGTLVQTSGELEGLLTRMTSSAR